MMSQGDPLIVGYARPKSLHPAGFTLAFCDGRTQFVSETIAYEVYMRLMSSNGKQFKHAGINNSNPINATNPTVLYLQSQPVKDGQY